MSLEVEDIYPLAPMQQGMLFHSLLDPESGVYVEQISCVLRGDLSVPAFSEAWRRAIDRHPLLRTAFVWEDLDEPLQVVQPGVALPLDVEDWRTLNEAAQREHVDTLLARERATGFDLSDAPLMRLHLARLADDRYQLSWTHHHLLFDGWSLPLLLGDVMAHYEALRLGQEPALPRPRPYRDYIAWLQQQDAAAAERYWRTALAGFVSPTPLVMRRATDATPGNLVARSQLTPEASAALQALARRYELTLNTIMQGVWALLLHRYSGEDDVLFGATVSGRPADLAGAETMVGLFINTLPVRVQIGPDRPLIEMLRELQRRQAEQRQYEHTPLVQIQSWSDIPADQPLFESILVFENYPVDEALGAQGGSIQITDVESLSQTNYPLTLAVSPGRTISFELSYDPRCFDAPVVERMLGHYQTLLCGLLAEIEQLAAALPMLTAAELEQLAAWNHTAAPYPAELCVHQIFAAHVVRDSGAPALVDAGAILTYAELDLQSNQLAYHLRGLGVGPECLVGICLERSSTMVIAALGVLKAGAAYLPLDPEYPVERLAWMLEDARPSVLLTVSRFDDGRLAAFAGKSMLHLDNLWPQIAALPATALEHTATPENLAYVIYTSGSTGRPKGVLLPHQALSNFVTAQAHAWQIG
ncbi:MAG: AMP-binding protein, partial [Oscillochloris sp.]|nr:AMP-binding protein [Oscillochloris sp.]